MPLQNPRLIEMYHEETQINRRAGEIRTDSLVKLWC